MASISVVNENCWLTRHNIWMKIRDWLRQQLLTPPHTALRSYHVMFIACVE